MNATNPGVVTQDLQNSYGSVDAILLHLELPGSNRVLYNVTDKALQFPQVITSLYLSSSGTECFCSCCSHFSFIDLLSIIAHF